MSKEQPAISRPILVLNKVLLGSLLLSTYDLLSGYGNSSWPPSPDVPNRLPGL